MYFEIFVGGPDDISGLTVQKRHHSISHLKAFLRHKGAFPTERAMRQPSMILTTRRRSMNQATMAEPG